jgi:hypothetical protein
MKKSTIFVYLLVFVVIIGIIATMGYSIYYVINYISTDIQPLIPATLPPADESLKKQTIVFNTNTKPNLEFVSATEYTKGDGNGSTIVKLTDWKGDKINTSCYEKILYPDKTTYIDWTLMTQQWIYGNYYMDFVIPEPLGVYDQEVNCYISGKNISIGKGFHVGNLSNIITSKTNELQVDDMSMVT